MSRSETASSELRVGRAKPRLRARTVAVDRERGSGERAGAERAFVGASERVVEAGDVAQKHLDPGETPVAEGDRLGAAAVGVAGHWCRGFVGRAARECLRDVEHAPPRFGERVLEPEPEIHGDLIVARASGVELARQRTEAAGERRLDVRVHVLVPAARRNPPSDDSERRDEPPDLGRRERARAAESLGPCDRPADVLGEEGAVEAERVVQARQPLRRRLTVTAAPEVFPSVSQRCLAAAVAGASTRCGARRRRPR